MSQYRSPSGEIIRGGIYYVTTDGADPRPTRPAIVVSNSIANRYGQSVEVVFLSSQDKKPLPTHAPVMCKVQSTALCEDITTVSKDRVGDYICTCTKEEMTAVEAALLASLGIDGTKVPNDAPQPDAYHRAERDIYRQLYHDLLNRIIGG